MAKTFNFKFGADKYGTNLSTYLYCRSTKTALFGYDGNLNWRGFSEVKIGVQYFNRKCRQ